MEAEKTKLEARIRELEEQLKIEKDLRLNAEQDVETAEERIQKARGILEVAYRYNGVALVKTLKAALEGK